MCASVRDVVSVWLPKLVTLFLVRYTVLRPNMDSYVFIRAVERTEQVKVDPE